MKERRDKNSYGIVLLAAGTSGRLGRSKQLLEYKGDSLLNHAIKTAKQAEASATAVVLGAEAGSLMDHIRDFQVDTVLNQQFQEGIASSIRCGVRYMMDHAAKIDRIVMMVCDQPYVDAAHILTLINKHTAEGAKIVASFYAGRKGVPALFDKTLFPELLALAEDVGAKHLIEKYDADAAIVPFPPGAIDIDTEEDYGALLNTRPRETGLNTEQ